MFKKFGPWQCHVPRGVSSMYFSGMIYRFEGNYPDGTDEQIKQFLLTTFGQDIVYTIPITLPEIIKQVKQYSMMLIVNLNEVIREDLPKPPLKKFGRVAGIIAGILLENGFNEDNCAIGLFNEPAERWHLTEMEYVQYCYHANKYVKGRIPLLLSNEEYHRFNEKIIFEQTTNIPKRIWGIHHLSSLRNPPIWQNIIDAKTQANEWNVPIFCNEGGSWFKSYQSTEGHNINIKLMQECAKYDYLGYAQLFPDINDCSYSKILGYRKWDKNYTVLKSKINWKEFENELKKYPKEEQPMPEDRNLKVIPGYMHGEDVKKVQTKLREIGFDLKIDSWYGPQTERAVKKFQELTGLDDDGVVGPITKEKLKNITVETFYPEVFQDIYVSKNYSIEAIDYYLDTFAHPDVYGHGKYFVQGEQETGIPAEWQLANGAAESSYKGGGIGSSPIAQKYNNLFGWGIPDSGPTSEGNFKSFAECIPYVAKEIKRLFLDPDNWRYHGDHIFGIEVRYSTAVYNGINKAVQYRRICKFMDQGIKHRVPEHMEDLIPLLKEHFVSIER